MMDRFFEKDLTLKALSIGLAVLLWLQATALTGPVLPQSVRDVPVQLRNLGQGLVVLTPQPAVTLLVRASSETLRHLGRDSINVYVDLRGAGLGSGAFAVEVEPPDGVTVVQVSPGVVEVDIDAWDSKQVPVHVWTVGSPADEHAMREQRTRPTDLYVEGPRSKVQIVTRVVASVDITGAKGEIARTVMVRPVNAEGAEVEGVTVTPSAVDVTIAIVQLPPVREASVRASIQGRPAAGYAQEQVTISPATVRVWASGAAAGDLRYLWTYPIDIDGLSSSVTRDVLLLAPDGVEKVEPTVVRVTVTIAEEQAELEFEDLPVTVTGLGEGLKAEFEPLTVDVLVRGPQSLVRDVTAEDVVVRIDLSGRRAGTYQVSVTVSLPEGVVAKTISPSQIRVVLEPE